jgi:hypothetical protein
MHTPGAKTSHLLLESQPVSHFHWLTTNHTPLGSKFVTNSWDHSSLQILGVTTSHTIPGSNNTLTPGITTRHTPGVITCYIRGVIARFTTSHILQKQNSSHTPGITISHNSWVKTSLLLLRSQLVTHSWGHRQVT